MNRLLATLRRDVTLQFRNGFYYAVLFVLAMWAIFISQISVPDLGWFLPLLVVGNLLMTSYYFIAGLVLLEKGEGSLQAQVVTPLRVWEYLASKAATLTLLGMLENLAIVVLLYGLDFAPLLLVAGIVVSSAMLVLAGFVAIARYDSINEYLLPSVLYTSVISLPLLTYLARWDSWLPYLHPLQAPLVLMRGAFGPVEPWQLVYGLLYSGLWSWLLFRWSQRSFQRFMIAGEGAH